MAASYREIRRFPDHALSQDAVAAAIEACGFKLQKAGESSLRAHAPLNLWSFGENIEVHIGSFGSDTVMDVTSTCVLPTQIMDWGRNRKNVQRLFDRIMHGIPASPTPEAVHRCGRCDYVLLGVEDPRCPECGQDLTSERAVIAQARPRSYLGLGLLIALLLTIGESAIWLLTVGNLQAFGVPAYVWILIVIATAAIINFTTVMFMFGLHHVVQRKNLKEGTL